MNEDMLEEMDESGLREYLRFLLWHYRVIDAFWFLYVAEKFDQPAAERTNERVWERVSKMAAADLVKRFHITEKGLKGLHPCPEALPLDNTRGVSDRGKR